MASCYVHIPFCDSICSYCDFCRMVASESTKDRWLQRIVEEIKMQDVSNLDTLYFGGGTPSSLSLVQFETLASCFQGAKEFTVECNPESLTLDKIRLYKKYGVNRISLGVQSFQDPLLRKINRKHTKEDVMRCISLLKEHGIFNISIDLMYGLPGQSLLDLKADLEIFHSLDLVHLSIYSLQIEANSVFGKQRIEPCDPDLEADMYEYICLYLENHGFLHYEISSFCKPGYYSKHNLAYWQDEDFLGIGVGASGKEAGIRYDNTKFLKQYLEQGSCRCFIDETKEERAFDAIMMALRTSFGLDVLKWNARYGMDFFKRYDLVLKKYADVLTIQDSFVVPSVQAMEILNTILVDFLMVD